MKIELWIISWILFAVAVVYWDMHRWGKESLSVCHNVEIKMMNNRSICTECEMYCEVK